MLTNFKRRIAKLESLSTNNGPLEDFWTEVEDYAQRTGASLDDAAAKFVPDLSNDDLRRFLTEMESAAGVAEANSSCQIESSEPAIP